MSNGQTPLVQKFWGLVEMTLRLVHASYSETKGQAVKLTFFAACLTAIFIS